MGLTIKSGPDLDQLRQAGNTLLQGRELVAERVGYALPEDAHQSATVALEAVKSLMGRAPGAFSARTSVTHSAGWSLAVGVWLDSAGSPHRGIGVDLEALGREIKPGVLERVTQPAERHFGLEPLEFWVLKEACFKANPALDQGVISQYQVVDWDPDSRMGVSRWTQSSKKNAAEFRFALVRDPDWAIGLAIWLG